MKRFLLATLTVISLTGLIACGTNDKTTQAKNEVQTEDSKSKTENNSEEKKEEIKTVAVGSTINGKSADITINKIEFSYDVLPDKTDGVYTHYAAESGKVYINIDADVKNTQKQDLACDKVMTVEADYNGGYKYKSQPIVEDSSLGFTYANITSITPLENKGMRFLVSCPQEVEQSTNPLILTFNVDGEKYQYKMR